MNKIFILILGISLILFGIGIIINPEFYDSKHDFYVDFSGINIPFGLFLCVLGIFFIFLNIRRTNKDKELE
jgi:drug/metabolite transporter (DMT)-like permease